LRFWIHENFCFVQEPFGIWTESPTGGATNFATGQGGFLQVLIFGWPGMRILQDCLQFNPQLPENSQQLTLRGLSYKGLVLDIAYDSARVRISVKSSSSDALYLCAKLQLTGEVFSLNTMSSASFVRGAFQIGQCKPTKDDGLSLILLFLLSLFGSCLLAALLTFLFRWLKQDAILTQDQSLGNFVDENF
jgi:hypothetical protein